MEAQKVLTNLGTSLASNQVEYHLLETPNREKWLNGALQRRGIKVIAYSPLAMGILSGKYSAEKLPTGVRGVQYNREFLTRIQPLIRMIKKIGLNHDGKTAAQVAING
jgi:aryl-alcohol dehydrogenase-like predicted oxidoreductase